MSNMICSSCSCGCFILPSSCLRGANRRIANFKADDYPEILEAVNTFILIGKNNDGILGIDCFNALCADIKSAQAKADAYREENVTATDEKTEFWYYLSEIWYNLLKNNQFVNMYAAYVVYYYYSLGFAESETTLDGDVKHKRSSSSDQDAAENIDIKAAGQKTAIQKAQAKGYYDAFINLFWNQNKSKYSCRPKVSDCEPAYLQRGCSADGNCDVIKKKPFRPRPTVL